MSVKCIQTVLFLEYFILQFSLLNAGKMTLDGTFEHLKCWLCNSTVNCIQMVNISDIEQSTCDLDQPFCKVQQHYYKGSVELFTRGCARECEPGCGTLPILNVQWCASCCSNSLCNTDRARSQSRTNRMDYLFVYASICLLFVVK